MKFNEMTIEQLKAYRASVEAYGTASVIDGHLMKLQRIQPIR